MGLQTDLARAGSGLEAWQRLSKIAFFALTVGYYPLIGFRYLLFPDFGVGPAQANFVTALIMLVIIPALWVRLANPGLFWQYLICIGAIVVASQVALIAGTQTFWPGPLLAAASALLISYPVVSTSDKSREVWGLTLRQRGLAALFVSAIIGIGLIAWFSHEGEAREAHLLVRSVFSTLLV
ncbi:hypothetical protein, partial [Altererythrobacter litoralis]|nr:hypothetical protein [Erythrobacteraceae bacterium 1XM1-14]